MVADTARKSELERKFFPNIIFPAFLYSADAVFFTVAILKCSC